MGYSFLVGPPVGGALYNAFGFRGPFIFAIIVSMVDFVGRLLIIERKDALRWGVDPAAVVEVRMTVMNICLNDHIVQQEASKHGPEDEKKAEGEVQENPTTSQANPTDLTQQVSESSVVTQAPPERLPLLKVVATLLKSPRAMVTIMITLIQAFVISVLSCTDHQTKRARIDWFIAVQNPHCLSISKRYGVLLHLKSVLFTWPL